MVDDGHPIVGLCGCGGSNDYDATAIVTDIYARDAGRLRNLENNAGEHFSGLGASPRGVRAMLEKIRRRVGWMFGGTADQFCEFDNHCLEFLFSTGFFI